MPHITVKMYKGHSEEKKQRLSDEITKVFGEVLGSSADVVSIAILEYEPSDWDAVYNSEIENNPNLYKVPNYPD